MTAWEIPETLLSEKDIEVILNELDIRFSKSGVRDIIYVIGQYQIDIHFLDELQPSPSKNAAQKREELNLLINAAENTKHCLNGLNPATFFNPQLWHRAERMLDQIIKEANDIHSRFKITGQGKGGGPGRKYALPMLTQKLIEICQKETGENFIISLGYSKHGKKIEYSKYNASHLELIFRILSRILTTEFKRNDLKKIIESIINKPFEPQTFIPQK